MHLLHRTAIIGTLKQWARFAASFPSSLIRPSLRAVNCRCMRKLCLPFYFLGVNLKFLPLRRSQGLILFKVLRQIFQVKSSYYHRVLHPSQGDCSNECLLSLANRHAPRVLIPSHRISVQRLRYLGHVLRHFEALEHRIIFHTSHALRRLSSPFRLGRPRAHWPEIALSEAFHRSEQLRRNQHPTTREISHPMYATGTQSMVHIYFGPSLADWYDTTVIWNTLSPIAMDRDEWDQIVFPRNLIVHSNTADV